MNVGAICLTMGSAVGVAVFCMIGALALGVWIGNAVGWLVRRTREQ